MHYIENKSNKYSFNTHHFLIISLHVTIIGSLEVIYIYCMCIIEIVHNSVLLCTFPNCAFADFT